MSIRIAIPITIIITADTIPIIRAKELQLGNISKAPSLLT